MLSIWHQAYVFLNAEHEEEEHEAVTLPLGVRAELFTALTLGPFFSCPMNLPWQSTVFMMDSSLWGAGLIATQADPEEILHEAQFAESQGWTTTLEEVVFKDSPLKVGRSEEDYDPFPPSVPLQVVRALHTFSGPRRPEDLEFFLKVFA